MTNREKYKEVFGMEPDNVCCPTNSCKDCPMNTGDDEIECDIDGDWWGMEYKEVNE